MRHGRERLDKSLPTRFLKDVIASADAFLSLCGIRETRDRASQVELKKLVLGLCAVARSRFGMQPDGPAIAALATYVNQFRAADVDRAREAACIIRTEAEVQMLL